MVAFVYFCKFFFIVFNVSRIVISVTNDLVTDQRVHRSCMALHDAGHEVVLIGRKLPGSGEVRRPYTTLRMRLIARRKALFYAEYNLRLFVKLLFMRADMYYANDTDTLLANSCAALLRRKTLFFDAHELFPEVPELVGRKRVKAVWQWIERHCVPHVDGAVTVCQSIADHYRKTMGIDMQVVRNVPDGSNDRQPADEAVVRRVERLAASYRALLLYQGSVNVGRGIDRMMDAMQWLDGCCMVVAGVGDEYEALLRKAATLPYSDRVVFLGRVEPATLHCITPLATMGLCLLDNMGLNYYYSLPNRVGDFVAASVPLLATDFPEIRRVVQGYGVGYLVGDQQGRALAQAVDEALRQWDDIPSDARLKRFDAARADLSWSSDREVLLSSVAKALQRCCKRS